MEDRQLNEDEIRALAAAYAEPSIDVKRVPVDIYTSNGVFVVSDEDAWAYEDLGIFATGSWGGDGQERDLLIPYDRIRYVEFHFPQEDAQAPAEVEGEQQAA